MGRLRVAVPIVEEPDMSQGQGSDERRSAVASTSTTTPWRSFKGRADDAPLLPCPRGRHDIAIQPHEPDAGIVWRRRDAGPMSEPLGLVAILSVRAYFVLQPWPLFRFERTWRIAGGAFGKITHRSSYYREFVSRRTVPVSRTFPSMANG